MLEVGAVDGALSEFAQAQTLTQQVSDLIIMQLHKGYKCGVTVRSRRLQLGQLLPNCNDGFLEEAVCKDTPHAQGARLARA